MATHPTHVAESATQPGRNTSMNIHGYFLRIAALTTLLSSLATADPYTWIAGAGNWNVDTNWDPNSAHPGAADLAFFASTSPSGTVTVVGNQPVYGIEYQAGTPGRTITGGTLLLGAGGIVVNDDPTADLTIASAITLTGPTSVNNYSAWPGEKYLNLNGTLDTAGHALSVFSGARVYLNGRITGSGALTTTNGTTYLRNGNNDFSGSLTVLSGTTAVDGSGVIASAPAIAIRPGAILIVGDTGNHVPDDGITSFGRIGNDTPVDLQAGRLKFVGRNSTPTSEIMGTLNLDNGRSQIVVTNGTSSTATLTAATLARHPETRALGILASDTFTLGASSQLKLVDGGATLTTIGGADTRTTDKPIVHGLIAGASATRNGHWGDTFVRYDPANGFVPLAPATDFVNATAIAFPTVNADGNDNVRLPWTAVRPINDHSTITLDGNTTVNSLVFFNDNASSDDKRLTITGAAGTTLAVKSGQILAACTSSSNRYYVDLHANLTLAFGAVEGVLWGGDTHYGGLRVYSSITGSNGLTLTTRTNQTLEGAITLGGDNRGLSGTISLHGGDTNNGTAIITHRYGLGNGGNDLFLGSRSILYLNASIVSSQALTVGSVLGSGTIRGEWNMENILNIGGDGTGGATRTINLLAGGLIAPGTSTEAGTIALGWTGSGNGSTVAFKAGTVALDIFGPSQFDALSLDNGANPLTVAFSGGGHPGSRLSLNLDYLPADGELFRIVTVGGASATTGTFNSPGAGTAVYGQHGGYLHKFDILYNSTLAGGDGNDVVLRRSADPTAYAYEWGVDASGLWSASDAALDNWRHTVQPDVRDAHVLFGNAIGDARTITLATAKTAGHLVFDNSHAYAIDASGGSNLTLDATSGPATLTVVAGSHAISAPILLNQDLTVAVNQANDRLSLSGTVAGNGRGLLKTGNGTLILTGTHAFTGATTVAAGTLVVDGDIASSSQVTVSANASLAGGGTVGAIGGAGSVNPGSSPGLLTATQVDPTGGLDFNFEFTLANAVPTWAAVENDVLRLTDPTTPFTAALDGNNVISLFLSNALYTSLVGGDLLYGGFYTDAGNTLADLQGAAIMAYFQDDDGVLEYNGLNYSPVSTEKPFGVSFTLGMVANDQFADGGYLSVFTASVVIPEPTSLALLALAGLAATRRRRQR